MLCLFSHKNRPVHLGGFPLERLPRQDQVPEFAGGTATEGLQYYEAALSPEKYRTLMQRGEAPVNILPDWQKSKQSD